MQKTGQIKYSISIEREGNETKTSYEASDCKIFLKEYTLAELWTLYHMADRARAEIYSMISMKGDGEGK